MTLYQLDDPIEQVNRALTLVAALRSCPIPGLAPAGPHPAHLAGGAPRRVHPSRRQQRPHREPQPEDQENEARSPRGYGNSA